MAFFKRGNGEAPTAETKSQNKPQPAPVDLKATKDALGALRGAIKDAAAAGTANTLVAQADDLIATTDANLKQANINNAQKGAGGRQAHEVGVATGQKVAALRTKADVLQAQVPAAEKAAKAALEQSKTGALAKKAETAKEGQKSKLSQKEVSGLKKAAFKEVDALKGEARKLRSQARKIETETRKTNGRDDAAAFKKEVRDGLKEIKSLLINGNGTLTQQMETAAKVEAAAKGKVGGRDLTASEISIVGQRARYAPKGGTHAARAEASKAAAAEVGAAR